MDVLVTRYVRDPADLFTVLYDKFTTEFSRSKNVSSWLNDSFWNTAFDIAKKAPSEKLSAKMVDEALTDPQAHLAILCGLDIALWSIRQPCRLGTSAGAVDNAAYRYRLSGQLNSLEIAGVLLPKFTVPGGPSGQPTLDGLIRSVVCQRSRPIKSPISEFRTGFSI